MSIVDVQKFSNGHPASRGKVYIGLHGSNEPETNPVTIYSDYLFTTPITVTDGVDLDQDGFPLVDGIRTNIYVNGDYSFQIRDRNGAAFFPKPMQFIAVGGGSVPEAPSNGLIYGRSNEDWIQITSDGSFDPAAPQTITGQWSFDISGGKSFYATDDLTFAAMTQAFGIFDHDIVADALIANTVINNTVSGKFAVNQMVLKDDGTSSCIYTVGGAAFSMLDSASSKTIKLSFSGTDYITIDHILGTVSANITQVYADEAAAVTAGLATDTVYKTATGELRIKL